MNENQVISLVATALVGIGVTWFVSKLSPKYALLIGPAAAALAHQTFDEEVAAKIRRALG
jgi:hypothetical protein